MCYIHSKTLSAYVQKADFNPGNKTHKSLLSRLFVLNKQSKSSSISRRYDLKIRNNHIDIYLI